MKRTITRFAPEFEKAELGHPGRQVLFAPLIAQFLATYTRLRIVNLKTPLGTPCPPAVWTEGHEGISVDRRLTRN